MPGYDIILLDADATLFDFPRAEEHAFLRAMRRHGFPAEPETLALYSAINEAQWKRLERGELTQEALKTERFRLLFERLGLRADPAAFNAEYLDGLAEGAFAYPDAAPLCRALKEAGRRLYVATNGVYEVQTRRLARSDLRPWIDGMFVSQEVGFHKPRREYFDEVFRRLGWPDRSRCILLGDSLTSDMQGGRNAGIATCWYNPSSAPCGRPELCDFEIGALPEFLPIALGMRRATAFKTEKGD